MEIKTSSATRKGNRKIIRSKGDDQYLNVIKQIYHANQQQLVQNPAIGLNAIVLIAICLLSLCGSIIISSGAQLLQGREQSEAATPLLPNHNNPELQQSGGSQQTNENNVRPPATTTSNATITVTTSTPSFESILPLPDQRPNVLIDLKERARGLGETIQIVSDKVNCRSEIVDYYKKNSQYHQLDAKELRRQILEHLDVLLKQHQAAVDSIVSEAERLSFNHVFNKSLRVNYTDVHRLRNLDDWQSQLRSWEKELELANNGQPNNGSSNGGVANPALVGLTLENMIAANPNVGISGAPPGSDRSGNVQPTSINGGAPVIGPPEWQTPIKNIVMHVNKNFGDIPVNTSMSAVHLPLPIYPGLPEIMNTIAWTEGLDEVFRKNLANYAHVHHQYYGDHLGPLRTFPAHKWRISRLEPDLFDARTRPWYSAGVATPKDVVILVDSSGSMTGLRREIAKGVVFEILDTLNNNDHFSVLRFSETVTPVGIPTCQLRRPRLALDLARLCSNWGRFNDQTPDTFQVNQKFRSVRIQQQQEQQQGNGDQQSINNDGLIGDQPSSDAAELVSRAECASFERQWNQQHAYLRDHPELIQGINASYITDDAYGRSINNITNDIRDAYMLPATSRNIRYLKANFSMPTAGIANFTHALMAGFELLNAYNFTHDHGSQCNRAIMLITDGAIRDNEDVFNRYNYPGSPVRVFTYMIGREVGDIKPTKAMACKNRGYYTNVINLSEIREQVLKYLPVFARPAILAKQHPTSWTGAYGDETYQVLTDWVLELKRRDRARLMLTEERERAALEANSTQFTNIEVTNITEYDDLPLVDEQLRDRIICEEGGSEDAASIDQSLEEELDPLGYNELACFWAHSRKADLLTSVVKPVYSQKNFSIAFERVLSKNVWTKIERKLRDARLLGVGAVDLRVADLINLAPSHLLGPNAYSILIGPNGFVLHHPELRALLEDPFDKHSKILKPNFNSVDLTQVEQVHARNETEALQQHRKLIKFRDAVAKRHSGVESVIVKKTIDCRRRAHLRNQLFYFAPVKDTPFSLVLAFPNDYGLTRATAKLDLNSKSSEYLEPLSSSIGRQQNLNNNYNNEQSTTTTASSQARESFWTLHPDYRYCEGGLLRQFGNDSTGAFDFLLHMNDAKNNLWSKIVLSDLTGLGQPDGKYGTSDQIHCDKNLIPSLLFDAAATSETRLTEDCPNSDSGDLSAMSFEPSLMSSSSSSSECNNWCSRGLNKQTRSSLSEIFGLELSFVATRSGLTRARLFDSTPRTRKLAETFLKRHPRAVDEPWYSRTVDFNMRFMEDAIVISVPYNAYVRLIAKLRQRITQRQPTQANSSRLNCDPDEVSELPPESGSETPPFPLPTPAELTALSAEGENENANNGVFASANSTLYSDEQQSDENTLTTTTGSTATTTSNSANQQDSSTTTTATPIQTVNYIDFTTYELLDIIANSSVHVSSYQTVMVHFDNKRRAPVAVSGQLYDYAHFAKSFLNKTNLLVQKLTSGQQQAATGQDEQQQQQQESPKIDLCPGGVCPSRCGFRNDSIDCLLIDFNSFIIVSEDLVYIGRSLADYDDRLMASLVERRVFQQVKITDYQAICTRNDQQTSDQAAMRSAALAAAAAAASQQTSDASSSKTPRAHQSGHLVLSSVLSNLAASFSIVASTFFAMLTAVPPGLPSEWSDLGKVMQMGRSAVVDAQSSSSASSSSSSAAMLATLPNKTFLRPCERIVTVYETPIHEARSGQLDSEKPIYYASRCKCPSWYVYAHVPKTNLIMLVVNTTNACRRRCLSPEVAQSVAAPIPGSPLPNDQQSTARELLFGQLNRTSEEQVCSMLERADSLQTAMSARNYEPGTCISYHPDEAHINICGAATSLNAGISSKLLLLATSSLSTIAVIIISRANLPRMERSRPKFRD